MIKLAELLNEKSPCWKGYKQIGMKEKDGRQVPNCVPIDEGLDDTSWTGEKGQKITLQQLLDAIKDYPVIQVPIEKVEKIIIKKDSGGIESDRLSAADIKYPIIIIVDDSGNYKYVLDGNHRANKAIAAGVKSIPAKLVNTKKLPQEFQNVLGEAFFIGEDDIEEYDVENADDIKEFVEFMREYQQQLNEADCGCLLEAKYQGRTVPLGKPMRGDSKKFKVYVKNPKTGKVVKVNFGAKGMNIKKNNPVRRKSFRARHNCANPGPRTKARYWSCRKW
jgi:hypothetical protein